MKLPLVNQDLARKVLNISIEMEDMLRSIHTEVENNNLSFAYAKALCLCGHAEEIKLSILDIRNVQVGV